MGSIGEVTAPSDAAPLRGRQRYELEKRELLDGLAADRQSSGR
jgi:hypothetical protein